MGKRTTIQGEHLHMGMVTHPHITTDDDGFSAQQAPDDTFNQKSRQGACGQRQEKGREQVQAQAQAQAQG